MRANIFSNLATQGKIETLARQTMNLAIVDCICLPLPNVRSMRIVYASPEPLNINNIQTE